MAATLNPADDGTRKKRRMDESDDDEDDLENVDDSALKGFHLTKVLREDVRHKSINVLGKFEGGDDDAVLLLERKPFLKETLGSLLSKHTSTIATLENDIYSTHTAFPPPALSGTSPVGIVSRLLVVFGTVLGDLTPTPSYRLLQSQIVR